MDLLFWATRPLPHAMQVSAFGLREYRRLAAAPRPWRVDTRYLRSSLPDFATIEAPPVDEIPEVQGAVNPGERRALYALIRAMRAQSVLEIGTHIGGSTRMIVRALQANGGGTLTSVDIVDVNAPDAPWRRLGMKHSPQQAIEAMEPAGTSTIFLTQPSIEFLSWSHERYDLIFLDGGHEAHTVLAEVPLALKLLKPRGLILLHDYFPNLQPIWSSGHIEYGPYLAMRELCALEPSLRVKPLGELPWPTKEGSNRTCLAALLRAM